MRLPAHIANPALAALIAGSGYPSLERFAVAVNLRGWHQHGMKLTYDHVSVKRWLQGGQCQNPDLVAAVLGEAWGIPIPVGVVWPDQRDGAPPMPAHYQPWVAARTLEELGVFLRSDMLTRRETLASAFGIAAGTTFVDPIARWLGAAPVRLAAADGEAAARIGPPEVEGIERSTKYFAATDATVGGGLSREAAVGQLKYAVDLAQNSSYNTAVGNRLLAAIAELAGMVGWMCHDAGLAGPAQRYLVYGLQAARESTDPRAPLLAISILADMARHMRWNGHSDTSLRLFNLALDQLPSDRKRLPRVRAMLWSQRAWALAYLGRSSLPEVRSSLGLAFDLTTVSDAGDEDWQMRPSLDSSPAEVTSIAAASFLTLAAEDRALAPDAERYSLDCMSQRDTSLTKNNVLGQIRLARVRFVAGEPDQGAEDGDRAVSMASQTPASAMVRTRLRELGADSAGYSERAKVCEFRERLNLSLAG